MGRTEPWETNVLAKSRGPRQSWQCTSSTISVPMYCKYIINVTVRLIGCRTWAGAEPLNKAVRPGQLWVSASLGIVRIALTQSQCIVNAL